MLSCLPSDQRPHPHQKHTSVTSSPLTTCEGIFSPCNGSSFFFFLICECFQYTMPNIQEIGKNKEGKKNLPPIPAAYLIPDDTVWVCVLPDPFLRREIEVTWLHVWGCPSSLSHTYLCTQHTPLLARSPPLLRMDSETRLWPWFCPPCLGWFVFTVTVQGRDLDLCLRTFLGSSFYHPVTCHPLFVFLLLFRSRWKFEETREVFFFFL